MMMLAGAAHAAGAVNSGAYTVQYSAVNSMQIPASVAKDNGIERDGDTAVVMITLQKPTQDAPLKAVAADVTGIARTLMGDKSELKFRRVKSMGSVYSLVAVPIEDDLTLTFDLEVKATDGHALVPVTFNQTFYTD